DSECMDYRRIWMTTSLRGLITGQLKIGVLREAAHSGMVTGLVSTPFRVLQQLLGRIEHPITGKLLLEELDTAFPEDAQHQLDIGEQELRNSIRAKVPLLENVQTLSDSPRELILNNTWRATLAITGCDGLPRVASAGNVVVPEVAVKLSIRLP